MLFTDEQIASLKPRANRFEITETGVSSDRRGLQMRIFPAGGKTWLFRYSLNGKTKRIKLGRYPHMTLNLARRKLDTMRDQLEAGIDPVATKHLIKIDAISAITVRELSDIYHKEHCQALIKNKAG